MLLKGVRAQVLFLMPNRRYCHGCVSPFSYATLSAVSFFQAALLGAIQGITEFFPVSSSGHLLLVEHFLGLSIEELFAFDVVLHAATLLALVFLFWEKIRAMLCFKKEGRRLFGLLVLATVPAAGVGLAFKDALVSATRSAAALTIVATGFLCVALLLALAEWVSHHKKNAQNTAPISLGTALIMGCVQVAALVPGISRSGATIAAGLLCGHSRTRVAEFSFLMLLPATTGALILAGADVLTGTATLPPLPVTMVGFTASFIASLLAAKMLLAFIRNHSLVYFSVYLLAVAAFLFAL